MKDQIDISSRVIKRRAKQHEIRTMASELKGSIPENVYHEIQKSIDDSYEPDEFNKLESKINNLKSDIQKKNSEHEQRILNGIPITGASSDEMEKHIAKTYDESTRSNMLPMTRKEASDAIKRLTASGKAVFKGEGKNKILFKTDSPKEGDRNQEGLVFRDGRWHREGDDSPAVSEPETPREEVKSKQNDDQYEFARESSVPNFGKDVKGAARHKANMWKGLEEAESNGTASVMVARDKLLKAEPHTLSATIKPETSLSHLASYIAISSFPKIPFDEKQWKDYEATGRRNRMKDARIGKITSSPEELRKQYYEAYKELKQIAENSAQNNTDPKKVCQDLQKATGDIIKKLRKDGEDYYNPVANNLVNLNKRLIIWGAGKTSVIGRVREFIGKIQEKYGSDATEDTLSKIKEHALDVMDGSSFNETFDTKKTGNSNRFDPSEAYVNHANRIGGRVIDSSSTEKVKDFMIKDLKLEGVQFGNWVSDEERKHHMTKSAEAFADLADMLGMPDSSISLGGALSLAIGARGLANARAHYEPLSKVINLTRKDGVGSLAHEWGHALDHYLGGFLKFASSKISEDPVGQAMASVRKAFHNSGFYDRCTKEVYKRFASAKAREYWLNNEELFARCFERHIQGKLRAEGRENTYLVGLSKSGHPLWPSDQESEFMHEAFEGLFNAIRESKKQ
jgi:hypothetical protein